MATQEELLSIFKPITDGDIDALPNINFRNWAKKRLREGVLNNLLAELIKVNAAGDTSEALGVLSSYSETTGPEKRPMITLTDLGLRPEKKPSFLSGGVKPSDKSDLILYKHLGNLSHTLINRICRARQTVPRTTYLQSPLFEHGHRKTEQLVFEGFKGTHDVKRDDIVNTLKNIWSEASEAVEGSQDFFEKYRQSIKYLNPLLDLVHISTGISVQPVFHQASVFEKWLWISTLLTWANMFLNIIEGNLPLPSIYEIQALERNLGLSGGRIDGLEVVSNRKPFEPIDTTGFRSIGQLANFLRKLKNTESTIRIIEWKFAIGDGKQFRDPISPSDVLKSPLTNHLHQIERYLTLGALDEYFACGVDLHKDFWDKETLVKEGCVVYLFPTSAPIIHKVFLTPEQRRRVFVRDIVSRWENANSQALLRGLDYHYSSFMRRVNVKNELSSESIPQSQNVNSQFLLSLGNVNQPMPIIEVIDRHRVFLDKNNMIENRNGRYVMHLNKLIACLESDALKASSGFRLPQGGLVCCPVHKDKNPSLSVKLLDGFFYCFARSCKISGRFAKESIPQEFRASINPSLWVKRKDFFKDFAVPNEHHKLLEQAQRLLQEKFWDTEGECYVREKRMLDPDLAHEMGAGFGSSYVISGLLDAGFLLEELARIGLVRFSSRVSSKRGLFQLLHSRGMKVLDIRRKIGETKDHKPLFGLPYFALEGRVTFPLKLNGQYTNIYGRAVSQDAKVPHIKLSTAESGIHHGAFNEGILYSEKCNEVVITEGVFDAISLIQMFSVCPIAIIGTKNNLVAELVVRSGKNVAIAFDNDRGGREDTERLKKLLIQSPHFSKKVRDYTQSFIVELYGQELKERYAGPFDWRDQFGWDDWNTLFITAGKWLS